MLISLAELNPQEDEAMWCHRLKCLSWDNACCFAYLKTMYTASSKLVLHYEHVHVMSVIRWLVSTLNLFILMMAL